MEEVGRRVAEAINRPAGPYSAQAVQQWEVGSKKDGETVHVYPDIDALVAFASIVNCDLVWLLKGIEPSRTEGETQIPTKGRVVAIITPAQAIKRPIDYKSDVYRHTYADCSKQTFGFAVFDRRNAPEFDIGDHVLIDPARNPEPGVMVLAAVNGEPIFARYTKPQKKGKDWVCELEALDEAAWGSQPASSKNGDRIIGVMVDHAKSGSFPRHTR